MVLLISCIDAWSLHLKLSAEIKIEANKKKSISSPSRATISVMVYSKSLMMAQFGAEIDFFLFAFILNG